jgi:crotonobetainyl-CoA:carnitine CoA-transferase CaiB-like acyl-CoA transferase
MGRVPLCQRADVTGTGPGPLEGVRVIELATLFAGPLAGAFLSDFGADVVKLEHPAKPDPARGHGPAKDGVGLWAKVLGRNKRTVTVDLSRPAGAALLRRMTADADVLIENFRPGTLERWGLGPEVLHADNPRLVVARVTGFGQIGPYARRPGFGTLAEAMSGFAAATGEPDGPPTLPPFGLADSVAAWVAARTREEVIAAFEKAQAAVAAVYDVRDIVADPQFAALGTVSTVDDPELGAVRMQNVPFRMSATPGGIRFAGRPHGADTDHVLTGLGLSTEDIARLRADGVV